MGMSGQEVAVRFALTEALRTMSPAQLADLRDGLSAMLAGLRERGWPRPGEAFQQDFMEFLERETLVLADPDKYIRSDDPLNEQHYFICMKCDLPLPWLSIGDGCPNCRTDKWIGATTT